MCRDEAAVAKSESLALQAKVEELERELLEAVEEAQEVKTLLDEELASRRNWEEAYAAMKAKYEADQGNLQSSVV